MRYGPIRRRLSADGGRSWSPAQSIGMADQAGRPALLPDGRLVLAWVDRFGSGTILARLAAHARAGFEPASQVTLYRHSQAESDSDGIAAALDDMRLWSYGLPYAEALHDGDVMVVYYAGEPQAMDIHYARLSL